MTATPDLAVVIPHFEDVDRLTRCLAALTADPDAARAEIVVVDNGSAADVATAVAAFPTARLVVETARGAAAARNRGVRETTAPRLFFLDCDCVPAPGWIGAGLRALDRADVVGGAVELFDETLPPRSGAEAFETVFAFRQRDYVERKGFSVSANLLTWRRVFDRTGGFPPGVSEDVAWCRSATAGGARLAYAPEVRVLHPTRSDMPELVRKWRRMTVETFEIARAAPLGRARWGLRALATLVSPIVHGPQLLFDRRLRGAGERLRGLAALCALRARRAGWMVRQALTGRL